MGQRMIFCYLQSDCLGFRAPCVPALCITANSSDALARSEGAQTDLWHVPRLELDLRHGIVLLVLPVNISPNRGTNSKYIYIYMYMYICIYVQIYIYILVQPRFKTRESNLIDCSKAIPIYAPHKQKHLHIRLLRSAKGTAHGSGARAAASS